MEIKIKAILNMTLKNRCYQITRLLNVEDAHEKVNLLPPRADKPK